MVGQQAVGWAWRGKTTGGEQAYDSSVILICLLWYFISRSRI